MQGVCEIVSMELNANLCAKGCLIKCLCEMALEIDVGSLKIIVEFNVGMVLAIVVVGLCCSRGCCCCS